MKRKHKGAEQENDPGAGRAATESGLICWEDATPLSIWLNSLNSGSAVKPHYRAEQKHVEHLGCSKVIKLTARVKDLKKKKQWTDADISWMGEKRSRIEEPGC